MARWTAFSLSLLLIVWGATAEAEPLGRVRVVTDRAPDCSSLKSIVASVTRDCQTDDQRVIALYNFCRYDHYHHAYPSEEGGVSALKFINVYGHGLCGGQHTVQAALWEAAGYPWRYRGWSSPGHTTVEVKYGGRWHYLDTFLKFYTWMPDPKHPQRMTIAGQDDILTKPTLVSDRFSFDPARKVWYLKNDELDYVGSKVHSTCSSFLVCGDQLPDVVRGIRSSRVSGSPRGWAGIRFDSDGYSTDVNLGTGYSLTLDWNKVDDGWYFGSYRRGPHHTCGNKEYRNCAAIGPLLEPYTELAERRSWSNGTFEFRTDFSDAAVLDSLHSRENLEIRDGKLVPAVAGKPGRFVIEMASPYVTSTATIRMQGGAKFAVATDNSFSKFHEVTAEGLGRAVRGKYAFRLQVTITEPLSRLQLRCLVQHNQEALPYLAPGNNRVTVTVANPERLRKTPLVVTYAYCLGARYRTVEEMFDRDAALYRGHWATWSKEPIVVQHVINRSPYSFDIAVPTPKGKSPVYPRMLFLRREVLAPGQSPQATPVTPSTPAVGEQEYLAEVPNPWMIGTKPPQERPPQATKSIVISPSSHRFVTQDGEVIEHQSLEWLKDNSRARALLMDFEIKEQIIGKVVARATLTINVQDADNRAPIEAAATALQAPLADNSQFDFAKLGDIIGSTVVAKGNGPRVELKPAPQYEIDVTRAVRGWSRGRPAFGLGLRVHPNRAVDDGWTARFTPLKEEPAKLRIDFYTE